MSKDSVKTMSGRISREEQKQQTHHRLMRVAFRQFSRRGVLATRTVDIARKAGVSHGTIFAHFQTREDLIIRVINEFGSKVTNRLHELAKQGSGVREVLDSHLSGLADYESFYSRLVEESHALPREARVTLIGIQSAISVHLLEVAEREMRAGTIKRMPSHLFFNTWIGLLHHYLQNRDLFAPGESIIARYRHELLDHYMALISIPTGEKS